MDTIAAIATPKGSGGIAIIRVSGALVNALMHTLLRRELCPRQATLVPFFDDNTDIIDEGIAIFFPHPHSFTGEDVLELHGHGGPVVMDSLLQRILSSGARIAQPGEFSLRAFLNGKIDLMQAEAIADLINASSKTAARCAMRSLQGEFSTMIHLLNEKVIQLRMEIEASIDFAEEDIDLLDHEKITIYLDQLINELKMLQQQAKQGSMLREGITVVIAGEPNVGKSTLMNRLCGKDIAIVTHLPGTTRDLIRESLLIDDIPLNLIDTAGLRESDDVVEQEGIKRAYQEIQQADMVLLVTDVYHSSANDGARLPDHLHMHPVVIIRNKIDVTNEMPSLINKDDQTIISLSAHSGSGMDLLKNHIKSIRGYHGESEGLFLARRRHLDALARALSHLEHAKTQLFISRLRELAAEDLRQAQQALSEMMGKFSSDDLLGRIFANFCIGK